MWEYIKIFKSNKCVNFETLIDIIGFCRIKIMLDERKEKIELIYFITLMEDTIEYLDEDGLEDVKFIYKTHSDFEIRPTKSLEAKIFEFIKNVPEDRPDGELWFDNSKFKNGNPNFQYYHINQFKDILLNTHFQRMRNIDGDLLICSTGKILNMYSNEDIMENSDSEKYFNIPMNKYQIDSFKSKMEKKREAKERDAEGYRDDYKNITNRDAFDDDPLAQACFACAA